MSLQVSHLTAVLNMQRILEGRGVDLAQSMERLGSGFRVNHASDDPSGLIISEELRGQLAGIRAAQQNVTENINFMNTADATLEEVQHMLVSMRGMATVAMNGATSTMQRQALNMEFRSAVGSMEREISRSQYGGSDIFNLTSLSTLASGRVFQMSEGPGDVVTVGFYNPAEGGVFQVNGTAISFTVYKALLASASTLLSSGSAATALGRIETAIQQISLYRGSLGNFVRNNFESQLRSLSAGLTNLTESESRIRDSNYPAETTAFTRNQILAQASTATLAQANSQSQSVLQLLK